ncbi:MAG: sigma-54 dependent transcriptional regulator [Candidatus Hydrogenedentota bacterium]
MKSNFNILIVDDEIAIREYFKLLFKKEGYNVQQACDGKEALRIFEAIRHDLVFTDISMPGMSGMELLKKIKIISPNTNVILVTGFSSIESAVEAMKLGADDYLTKPLNRVEVLKLVERIYKTKNLHERTEQLKQVILRYERPEIIGSSNTIKKVLEEIRTVAASNVAVLITGESGTGKELVSRAIHDLSNRRNEPFIPINCAAVPKELLESEFFGYEKGAFSGALSRKYGLFEIANKGTLFLDEIAEMPPELQSKILRAIETKMIRRVGGTEEIEIDIRVISATNRDIEQEINKKRFKEDLYYRLATFIIHIPPIRERREDIPLLINNYIKKKSITNKKISKETVEVLKWYDWPGNVRELENVLERMILISADGDIELKHLPSEIKERKDKKKIQTKENNNIEKYLSLENLEKEYIYKVYNQCKKDKRLTAEILGIGLATLYRKLQRYKIE